MPGREESCTHFIQEIEGAGVYAACRRILDGSAERFVHHPSLQSLVTAVRDGCSLCNEYWHCLCLWYKPLEGRVHRAVDREQGEPQEDSPDNYQHGSNSVIAAQVMDMTKDVVTSFALGWDSLKIRWHRFDIAPVTYSTWLMLPTSALEIQYTKRMDLTGPSSEIALALASYWIQQCVHHTKCSQLRPASHYVPSRLIELSPPSEPARFRLVSSPPNSAVQYATLSYCWGTVDALKLVQSNTQSFAEGLDDNVLPLTFQHAFKVCRYLSISYIWIDSLCILQDDATDWARESAQMSSIYSHAYVSIAADASTDKNGGLFRCPHPRDRIPLRGELSTASYISLEPQEYHFVKKGQISYYLKHQPLNKRGWVYQERVLANRILHFTDRGPIWECDTRYASEAYQQGTPLQATSIDPGELSNLEAFLPIPSELPEDKQRRIENGWHNIVRDYSQTALTYPDDRPVAILGLAREIERITDMRYVAGLWKEYLISQLTWEDDTSYRQGRETYSVPGRAVATRQFPSFSWLSVDGPVLMPFVPMRRHLFRTLPVTAEIELGDVEVEPVLRQQGVVRLHAVLRKVRVIAKSTGQWDEVEWKVDGMEESIFISPDWSRPGLPNMEESDSDFFLIFLVLIYFEGFAGHLELRGLLLQRTGTRYRRIGKCEYSGYYEQSPWRDDPGEKEIIELI